MIFLELVGRLDDEKQCYQTSFLKILWQRLILLSICVSQRQEMWTSVTHSKSREVDMRENMIFFFFQY